MTTQPTYNEKQLLDSIAEGDEHAFRILFTLWHQKLGGYVLGWTKSVPLAEEIVQDVFVKIWVRRKTLVEIQNFDKYLYILSRNQTFNALRHVARESLSFRKWLMQTEVNPASSNDPLQGNLDYDSLIEKAVDQLPGQQRKVHELKYKQGMKYQSIGKELGIAPETARKHMQTATKFITAYLRSHFSVLLLILKFF